MNKDEQLKLDNQLCFPLYAAAKAVTKLYLPLLTPLGLTYTQYIVLLALYEEDGITTSKLGQRVYLDSGTLSPLLDKLEARGILKRKKGKGDHREKHVYLTEEGILLKEKIIDVPSKIGNCLGLTLEEAIALKTLCERINGEQYEQAI